MVTGAHARESFCGICVQFKQNIILTSRCSIFSTACLPYTLVVDILNLKQQSFRFFFSLSFPASKCELVVGKDGVMPQSKDQMVIHEPVATDDLCKYPDPLQSSLQPRP